MWTSAPVSLKSAPHLCRASQATRFKSGVRIAAPQLATPLNNTNSIPNFDSTGVYVGKVLAEHDSALLASVG